MSLDVYLEAVLPTQVFEANITHNLATMALEAEIYQHLWRPEELGISKASELIAPLRQGVAMMKADPDRFKALEPENKWGTYDGFVPWIEKYIAACEENPDATVRVSR